MSTFKFINTSTYPLFVCMMHCIAMQIFMTWLTIFHKLSETTSLIFFRCSARLLGWKLQKHLSGIIHIMTCICILYIYIIYHITVKKDPSWWWCLRFACILMQLQVCILKAFNFILYIRVHNSPKLSLYNCQFKWTYMSVTCNCTSFSIKHACYNGNTAIIRVSHNSTHWPVSDPMDLASFFWTLYTL